ncbi:ubiquitinyl hydrolase 1 [Malassezia vespertilionis]|uniref:Ubiquitin carboxyl-terminal hydrolase n=1 Tax=Malassezia vespertilionis TaxID=2020962 RepID=A0A2N1JFW6_9BASI|nr:ubiquitinyl hydrolase 1 [Malassezia vespertilionis]PKI85433.1 Yuh1p [Malassezia vespertilionis]WFD05154.1 ubiquitinyl hydrolase 1 [Malassezia vespertilionis]
MATSWVPLEANPGLFSEWSNELGLDTSKYAFHDIFGLDPELLAMVPQPTNAVLFLFPLSPAIEARRKTEDAVPHTSQDDVLWFPQTIGNACGTIGLLHAIANSNAASAVASNSALAQLLGDAKKLAPAERTTLLAQSKALQSVHAATAQQGQTHAPEPVDDVDLHFVAFVRGADGQLLELDGRRTGPVVRDVRVPAQEDLLAKTAEFVQSYYMRADPEQVQYNLIALAPNDL